MYLKSVDGKILYKGRFSSVKQGVEMAVSDGVALDGINLRQANLAGALMDKAKMAGASFWGANLKGADMSEGDYTGTDFRTANLLDTCFAEALCENANFDGAYFSRTILRGADLSYTRFSCPSIFSVDLVEVSSMEGAIYSHLGEVDCALSHAPIIIHGLQKPLIFMDDVALVAGKIQEVNLRAAVLKGILESITQEKRLG